MSIDRQLAAHCSHGALDNMIDRALVKPGKDPASIAVDDLASIDEFHIGGPLATAELAAQMGLAADEPIRICGRATIPSEVHNSSCKTQIPGVKRLLPDDGQAAHWRTPSCPDFNFLFADRSDAILNGAPPPKVPGFAMAGGQPNIGHHSTPLQNCPATTGSKICPGPCCFIPRAAAPLGR